MRRYIYIVILGILVSFTSCTMTDVDVDIKVKPSANSGLQFIGAAEDFDLHTVGTRADEEVSDSHISEMTLLIFKENGDMLPAVGADKQPLPSSHINIRKSNPTFLIEANKYEGTGILASMEAGITAKYYDNKATDLGACKIYIVANAYHLIGDRLENGEIKTENDLHAAILEANDSLGMPIDEDGVYIGLPMIGVAWEEGKYDANGERVPATFNLKYKGNNTTNDVATIPLKKLYSKICFTMQVNSFQYVQGGQIPEFKLTNVEVFNVPAQVRMGYQARDYVENYPDGGYWYEPKPNSEGEGESGGFSLLGTSLWPKRIVTKHDSSDKVEFHFFMPEHKVTPFYTETNYEGYPENLPKDRRQYYKPKLVASTSVGGVTQSKIATFVRIHGDYTTHNGEILQVSYDIYLGQNAVDDFEVKRNQQLNNIITINGLTNHKDAYGDDDTATDNISIDHRVQVTNLGYLLSMERETILDSHFEVRPLDITLSPGKKMTIQIPKEYKSWLAMESDAKAYTGAGSPYVSDAPRRGVRKYFTTNLVSELNSTGTATGNGGTITIETPADAGKALIHRIWFYIDENPNVYDKTASGIQAGESGYTVTNQDDKTNNRIAQTMYRLGKVNFYLSDDDSDPDTSGKPNSTINFQQWNLWRVWNKDGNRYYDIEHEEEYLNNYASDQAYRPSQDGMPYGLEGIQLSSNVPAYWQERHTYSINIPFIGDILSLVINALDSWLEISSTAKSVFAQSEQKPYYDFYLTRDAFPVDKLERTVDKTQYARDYQGRAFNEEIITTLLTAYKNDNRVVLNGVHLNNTDLKSAIAYVYNKNKRDSNGNVCIVNDNGTVDTNNIKWYLPAIDEIEDIALGAYDEFDRVFQNQEYWSCQPTYNYNTLRINPGGKTLGQTNSNYVWFEGEFYSDNTSRARSTSVYATSATDYTTIESGLPANVPAGHLVATANENGTVSSSYSAGDVNYDSDNFTTGDYRGNSLRDEVCRIRAVYRSGTGTRAQ